MYDPSERYSAMPATWHAYSIADVEAAERPAAVEPCRTSCALTEEAGVTAPGQADPPSLQAEIMASSHLNDLRLSAHARGHLRMTLLRLGIHTLADALAMGTHELAAQSKALSEGGLGKSTMGALKALILHESGYTLPEARASAAEQHIYFDDITLASPTLGLPTTGMPNYFIGMWGPVRSLKIDHPTIGELLSLPWDKLQEAGDSKFLCFVRAHLLRTVVEPFQAAK